jgi:hypothetical protein
MKSDTILKRAELFEKMAFYGKRTDFLKALAQMGALEDFPTSDISGKLQAAAMFGKNVLGSIATLRSPQITQPRVTQIANALKVLEDNSVGRASGQQSDGASSLILQTISSLYNQFEQISSINEASALSSQIAEEKDKLGNAYTAVASYKQKNGFDPKETTSTVQTSVQTPVAQQTAPQTRTPQETFNSYKQKIMQLFNAGKQIDAMKYTAALSNWKVKNQNTLGINLYLAVEQFVNDMRDKLGVSEKEQLVEGEPSQAEEWKTFNQI